MRPETKITISISHIVVSSKLRFKNSALRVFSGTLEVTPLPWLSVLSNIVLSEASRRKEVSVNIRKHEGTNKTALSLIPGTTRKARSTKPLRLTGKTRLNFDFRATADE